MMLAMMLDCPSPALYSTVITYWQGRGGSRILFSEGCSIVGAPALENAELKKD